MNDIPKRPESVPPTFLVAGCTAPDPRWRGQAALAVLAVNLELAAYPYATNEWTRKTGNMLAGIADAVEHGGRIAVFTQQWTAQPHQPIGGPVCAAMNQAGIEPRGEIAWLEPAPVTRPTQDAKAQPSPHDPPMSASTATIVVGSIGSRTRHPDPQQRAQLRLPCRSDISDQEWHRDTQSIWTAEMHSAWTEAGMPYEAVRRLVRLHTYPTETVLVMGASASASIAALEAGRHCKIAAGNEAQTHRVAQAIAAYVPPDHE